MRLAVRRTLPLAIFAGVVLIFLAVNIFFAELASLSTDFMLWWWEKDIHLNNSTGLDIYPVQWYVQVASLQMVALGILWAIVIRRSIALYIQKVNLTRSDTRLHVNYSRAARASDLRWFVVAISIWLYDTLFGVNFHPRTSLDNWHYSLVIGVVIFLLVNVVIRLSVRQIHVIRVGK